MNPEELDNLLKRDPVAEVEKMIGGKIRSADEATDAEKLIFLSHAFELGAQKEAALKSVGDTGFSNTISDYQRIIESMGFRKVLEIPFEGKSYDNSTPPQETYFIYFQDQKGLLLSFDTYHGNVNGGHVYYNWLIHPSHIEDKTSPTSSGGWDYKSEDYRHKCEQEKPPQSVYDAAWDRKDPIAKELIQNWDRLFYSHAVWAGDHDCRQALRHNIEKLERCGSFVVPWKRQPWLWLLHHGDEEQDKKYEQINAERLAMLPPDVQKAIGL